MSTYTRTNMFCFSFPIPNTIYKHKQILGSSLYFHPAGIALKPFPIISQHYSYLFCYSCHVEHIKHSNKYDKYIQKRPLRGKQSTCTSTISWQTNNVRTLFKYRYSCTIYLKVYICSLVYTEDTIYIGIYIYCICTL